MCETLNHPEYPMRMFIDDIKHLADNEYTTLVKTFIHQNVKKNMEATSDIKWADPEQVSIDELNNRKTFFGKSPGLKTFRDANIQYDACNKPINPMGRTGLAGRGLLGRWGANHAADPIVAYLDDNKELWAIVVRRKDTGNLAIPGGMVDPGSVVSNTLRNEFKEEAASLDDTLLDNIFKRSFLLYEGYVNDPRNTDNSWMETSVHGVLITDDEKKQIKLKDEDDEHNTDSARWIKICNNSDDFCNLYADHKTYLNLMKAAVTGIQYQQQLQEQCFQNSLSDTTSDSDWSDISEMDTSVNVATNTMITRRKRTKPRVNATDDYYSNKEIDILEDINNLNSIVFSIISAAVIGCCIILMTSISFIYFIDSFPVQ